MKELYTYIQESILDVDYNIDNVSQVELIGSRYRAESNGTRIHVKGDFNSMIHWTKLKKYLLANNLLCNDTVKSYDGVKTAEHLNLLFSFIYSLKYSKNINDNKENLNEFGKLLKEELGDYLKYKSVIFENSGEWCREDSAIISVRYERSTSIATLELRKIS